MRTFEEMIQSDGIGALLFETEGLTLELWLESQGHLERTQDYLNDVIPTFSPDERPGTQGGPRRRPVPRVYLEQVRIDEAVAKLRALVAHARDSMSEFDLACPIRTAPGIREDPWCDRVVLAEQGVFMNLRCVKLNTEDFERAASAVMAWTRPLVPTALRKALDVYLDELWVAVLATDRAARELNAALASWSDHTRSVARQN